MGSSDLQTYTRRAGAPPSSVRELTKYEVDMGERGDKVGVRTALLCKFQFELAVCRVLVSWAHAADHGERTLYTLRHGIVDVFLHVVDVHPAFNRMVAF